MLKTVGDRIRGASKLMDGSLKVSDVCSQSQRRALHSRLGVSYTGSRRSCKRQQGMYRRPLSNKGDPQCLISASVGFRSDKTCAAEQEDGSCLAILRLGSNKMPGIDFA